MLRLLSIICDTMFAFLIVIICELCLTDSCRFGGTPNCAFPCRCQWGFCNEITGDCNSGSCAEGRPRRYGFGWKDRGCRVGNVAYLKKTAQTVIIAGEDSHKAVDGVISPHAGDCANPHQKSRNNASWSVDLGATYTIQEIIIFNRNDDVYYIPTNFMISVDREECLIYDGVKLPRYDLKCTTTANKGRYVKMQRLGGEQTNQLYICEFVIVGYQTIECPENCLDTCDDMIGCNTCPNGTKLPDCKHDCDDGYWGSNCMNLCGLCVNNEPCNKINGICENGCAAWYTTAYCTLYTESTPSTPTLPTKTFTQSTTTSTLPITTSTASTTTSTLPTTTSTSSTTTSTLLTTTSNLSIITSTGLISKGKIIGGLIGGFVSLVVVVIVVLVILIKRGILHIEIRTKPSATNETATGCELHKANSLSTSANKNTSGQVGPRTEQYLEQSATDYDDVEVMVSTPSTPKHTVVYNNAQASDKPMKNKEANKEANNVFNDGQFNVYETLAETGPALPSVYQTLD